MLFVVVAAWSGKRVLYHWAAPGYLMLFPLLGDWLARRLALGDRVVRRGLVGTAVLVVALLAFVTSEARWYWLPPIAGLFTPGHDPMIEAVDWTSVRDPDRGARIVASRRRSRCDALERLRQAGFRVWRDGAGGLPDG